MADDHEDVAGWRGQIEPRVSTLEATVETEARVRAQMDQDLSDLKIQFDVQCRLLQAVSHTQSEHSAVLRGHTALLQQHTAVLVDHTARLTRLETGVARLETGVARLETGLSTVQAGVQTIIGLLDRDIDGGESSQR